MLRNEFEDILILDTPYYKELRKAHRDTINFSRYIAVLKKIARDDNFIKMIEDRGGKELVYLGRKIFSLQEEFVANYMKFLSNESMVNQWEKFFDRYSNNLFEIYENFVAGDSDKVLTFEILNRKLLRDILTRQTMDKSLEQKMLISDRLGVVINQLFNYIRNSLTKKLAIKDVLIVESYEKIPFLPRCDHSETMKLLSKCILQRGLPESLFTAIFKEIITSYYIDTKDRVVALINEKTFLNKDILLDIFKSQFFFPNDASMAEILGLIKERVREMIHRNREKKMAIDKKIKEIRQKNKDTTSSIKEKLVTLTENFSTEEPIDNMIKKLRRNIITDGYDLKILKNEYQDYVKKDIDLNSITGFKPKDLQNFIVKNEWDPYIILAFNRNRTIDDERLQVLIKDAVNEMKGDKKAVEIINNYRVSGFLKDKYDTNKIYEKFQLVIKDVIIPFVKSFLLEELIEYYPKLSGVVSGEGVRYLAEEALSGRVSMVEKDIKIIKKEGGVSDVSQLNISHFRNLVSVLNYDIRGSTFMGTKLRDAKRESEIRNYFQESMLAVVGKYGGIPIKDTGDGGIVLFAANHNDVKNRKTLKLEPGNALSVVRGGIEMVKEAKKFVQDNISKYQDWFREADERKIDFEGATYATLSPTYQSIFQIGVGIASGSFPNEVYLDENAFGELDLTGMLVREANFYSKVKAKEKSTVICDDATVYNLLLNVNKFSFLSERGLRIDPLLLDIEQGLEYWMHQKLARRGFILDLYKIFVTQLGQEVTHPGSLKIMLGIFDIEIDETGEIKDGKGGRGKFLFEVSSEAAK